MHLEISLELGNGQIGTRDDAVVANKTSWQITHKWPKTGALWS